MLLKLLDGTKEKHSEKPFNLINNRILMNAMNVYWLVFIRRISIHCQLDDTIILIILFSWFTALFFDKNLFQCFLQ